MKNKIELDIMRADIPQLEEVLRKLKTEKTVKLTLDYWNLLQEATIK
ncbi:hypothetical protein LCGC14_1849220 [marine sediment metagenome]|uniref:Uncharacterized protein n=1 Tax=marine sediment metagenome TaxID=412755 RepID=A0A0F8VDI8_9ZZZZ